MAIKLLFSCFQGSEAIVEHMVHNGSEGNPTSSDAINRCKEPTPSVYTSSSMKNFLFSVVLRLMFLISEALAHLRATGLSILLLVGLFLCFLRSD